MSQVIFDTIDPTISGTTLASTLNDFKDALMTGCSGTSRPTETEPGGNWIDTTNDPTSWSFKIWTGTTDVEIFKINLTTGLSSVSLAVDSFQVKKISADTVGAVMDLVKRRIATNGQVLNGDVVGEIRMVGRTDVSGNPVVAKIIWTATDDQTTSAYGGTLSFWSTPDATATLTEHMKFIDGVIETIVPHKLNSQILVGQNVATTATIAQLSASKILVEMTGSTATDIQGINSGHDSKTITIHNRSSASVTVKHLDASALAVDRIKLPNSEDYVIVPEGSITLYYNTADTYWKIVSTSEKIGGVQRETFYGVTQTWTAPSVVSSVKLYSHKPFAGLRTERNGLQDPFGNLYAWGLNTNGQLGDASVIPKSSPVAVLGGLKFIRSHGATGAAMSQYGIISSGAAYSWGINTNGQLGVGDVLPRSSPVAVLGGFRFSAIYPKNASVIALSSNNTPLAWGVNTNGQLGDGSVVHKSSPVAVLGGLKFVKLIHTSGANTQSAVIGVTRAGVAYAWGMNTNGNLGTGDVASKSSPVAVLGGITFSDVLGGAVSSRYFNVGLTTAGEAYSWGANTSGQLGLGDVVPRSSPVAVLGGLTFKQLVACEKSESVIGVTSAGVAYAWGDNSSGQLGVGDVNARSSPVAVLGGLTFSKLIAFRSVSMGLTSDGTLYAWGLNANGQLGVGDTTNRSSPVAVLGGLKFIDVAFADGFTDIYSAYALAADGVMYSWGANANGTLGLGDVVPRSSPVAVLGAFSPDGLSPVITIDIDVTPGASYTISLGRGLSFFGPISLGTDIYKLEVEYLQ
jgi:alpha-tubulin suppressor-like RCC1 family protein